MAMSQRQFYPICREKKTIISFCLVEQIIQLIACPVLWLLFTRCPLRRHRLRRYPPPLCRLLHLIHPRRPHQWRRHQICDQFICPIRCNWMFTVSKFRSGLVGASGPLWEALSLCLMWRNDSASLNVSCLSLFFRSLYCLSFFSISEMTMYSH